MTVSVIRSILTVFAIAGVFSQASLSQAQSLSAQEEESLLYMREEEKLARDVYLVLGQKWSRPIFSNIASSEQRHMDATKSLIVKYNLPDPVKSDEVGVFTNPDLDKLYQELTERGKRSLMDAYAVGIYIEKTDIADLEKAIGSTDEADLKRVYGNLLQGSKNHLKAFSRE